MLGLILPILFPSWNFFDRLGPRLEIEYSFEKKWKVLSRPPNETKFWKTLLKLFINQEQNEYLFLISVAERYLASQNPSDLALLAARLRRFQPAENVLPVRLRILQDGKIVFTTREPVA